MTIFDDQRPVKRIIATFQREIADYVDDFMSGKESIKADQIALRMVARVVNFNARNWREAARSSMQGRRIYQALQNEMSGSVGQEIQRLVAQNAQLIGSLPGELRSETSKYALQQYAKGIRHETVEAELRKRFPQMAKSRVAMIARTEVSKAETAVTQSRAESMGIEWYEWSTSEDQRVRPSHRKMDGVLVNWNDPPSPEKLDGEKSTLGRYHAGNAPNCRCTTLPLIDLNEVRWPHRVFYDGRIQTMTLAQFKRLGNYGRIAA